MGEQRYRFALYFAYLCIGLTGLWLFLGAALAQTVAYSIDTVPNTHLTDRLNYVSNPDGILQAGDVEAINQIAREIEQQLGIEVAVVAIKNIGENDAREFATALFGKWGIGKQAKDNGLLIQLVTDPPQRSIVFETGYGLEGVLPDAITYRIQQRDMIPDLKAGNYSAAVRKGMVGVRDYLFAHADESVIVPPTETTEDEEAFSGWWLLFLLGLPIVGLLLAAYGMNRPKKCPRCGKKTYRYVGSEIIRKPTYFSDGQAVDTYRCSNCGYTNQRKRRVDRRGRSDAANGALLGGILGGGLGGYGGRRGGGLGGGIGGSWGGGRSGGGGSISRF